MLIFLTLIEASIAFMLSRVDEAYAPYSLGISLAIYASAFLLIWPWQYTAALVGLTWLSVAIAIVGATEPLSRAAVATIAYYLGTASLVGFLGQYFRQASAWQQFREPGRARTRARAQRGAAAEARAPEPRGPAHRTREPALLGRDARARVRALVPPGRQPRCDPLRPRPAQGRERPLRPCRGRPGPEGHGRRPPRAGSRERPGRAPGRRRVRRALPGHRPRERGPARRGAEGSPGRAERGRDPRRGGHDLGGRRGARARRRAHMTI